MTRRDGIELPVGDPMEQFEEMLTKRVKRLTSKAKAMDHGDPRTIEDSNDFRLRARYHALLRLLAETKNTLLGPPAKREFASLFL